MNQAAWVFFPEKENFQAAMQGQAIFDEGTEFAPFYFYRTK